MTGSGLESSESGFTKLQWAKWHETLQGGGKEEKSEKRFSY